MTTLTSGWFSADPATPTTGNAMLDGMKTTIHHVASCDDCQRTTVHQSVVEHGANGRAASVLHACESCAPRAHASGPLAPVLDMITARPARAGLAAGPVPDVASHLGAVAN